MITMLMTSLLHLLRYSYVPVIVIVIVIVIVVMVVVVVVAAFFNLVWIFVGKIIHCEYLKFDPNRVYGNGDKRKKEVDG